MSVGRRVKKVSSPSTVPSSSALRFSLRASLRWAIAPSRVALSDFGSSMSIGSSVVSILASLKTAARRGSGPFAILIALRLLVEARGEAFSKPGEENTPFV